MELKEISKEELKRKLELHRKWLSGEEGGVKLDLRNVDLRCANLRSADLRCADLSNANLSYADLTNVNLKYSNLTNSNLSNSDLSNSNLSNTDLRYANLTNSDLSKTKFYLTNLYKTKGNFVGVENIGSRNDTTHYFYNDNRIICGCFNGTIKEFKNKVKETYEKNSKGYKQYMIAINTLKKLAKLEVRNK